MRRSTAFIGAGAAALVALTACAVTELDPAAAAVRTISTAEAETCTFIDTITANNMNTLSSDPQADARARAFNRVAALGGNAFAVTSTDTQVSSSGIGSTYMLTGNVYRCGE